VPNEVVLKQLWIFQLDHRRARSGRRDDPAISCESLNGMTGNHSGIIMIAAVEVGLAAAGLGLGEIHLHSQSPQQANRGHSHLGKKHIAQAGHHQGCFQCQ